jgi:hypothetical protein
MHASARGRRSPKRRNLLARLSNLINGRGKRRFGR